MEIWQNDDLAVLTLAVGVLPTRWAHIVAYASTYSNPTRLGDPLVRDDTMSATF